MNAPRRKKREEVVEKSESNTNTKACFRRAAKKVAKLLQRPQIDIKSKRNESNCINILLLLL